MNWRLMGIRRRPWPAIAAATCRWSGARSRRGLRDGAVRGVVATNALELGIDIGELDAAVLTGYPGTVASHLAAGGPGRTAGGAFGGHSGGRQQRARPVPLPAPALPVRPLAGARPDQPRQPAHPDPPPALRRFELPFTADEHFGGFDPVGPVLDELARAGDLHATRTSTTTSATVLRQGPFPCAPAATTRSSSRTRAGRRRR
jgi:hypothetical protein